MALVAKDSFNRANTTLLTTDELGNAWQAHYGGHAWGIQNNRAYPVSTDYDYPFFVNAGISDKFAYSITCADYISSTQQIMWRIVGPDFLFVLQGTTVYKVEDGGWVSVATVPALVTGDRLRVEVDGQVHKIFINSVQHATFTSAANMTGTGFGFSTNNLQTRWDDFEVDDLSAPAWEKISVERIKNAGTGFTDIPVYALGTNTEQPLRMNTPEGIGFIPLVLTTDPNASRIRVRTPAGTRALKK